MIALWKNPGMTALCACAAATIMACSEPDPPKTGLTINSADTLFLPVGDTSAPITVTKVSIDGQGRENTDSDYPYFTLISADTAVAKVVSGRRVAGISAGRTTITAEDDRSGLISNNRLPVEVREP